MNGWATDVRVWPRALGVDELRSHRDKVSGDIMPSHEWFDAARARQYIPMPLPQAFRFVQNAPLERRAFNGVARSSYMLGTVNASSLPVQPISAIMNHSWILFPFRGSLHPN